MKKHSTKITDCLRNARTHRNKKPRRGVEVFCKVISHNDAQNGTTKLYKYFLLPNDISMFFFILLCKVISYNDIMTPQNIVAKVKFSEQSENGNADRYMFMEFTPYLTEAICQSYEGKGRDLWTNYSTIKYRIGDRVAVTEKEIVSLGITKDTASRWLRQLERAGWITFKSGKYTFPSPKNIIIDHVLHNTTAECKERVTTAKDKLTGETREKSIMAHLSRKKKYYCASKRSLLIGAIAKTVLENAMMGQQIHRIREATKAHQSHTDTSSTSFRRAAMKKAVAQMKSGDEEVSLSTRTLAKKLGYKSSSGGKTGTRIQRRAQSLGLISIQRQCSFVCSIEQWWHTMVDSLELRSKTFFYNGKVFKREINKIAIPSPDTRTGGQLNVKALSCLEAIKEAYKRKRQEKAMQHKQYTPAS
jgi:DNA-binding transcriptional regulator YhcF (GntR family)